MNGQEDDNGSNGRSNEDDIERLKKGLVADQEDVPSDNDHMTLKDELDAKIPGRDYADCAICTIKWSSYCNNTYGKQDDYEHLQTSLKTLCTHMDIWLGLAWHKKPIGYVFIQKYIIGISVMERPYGKGKKI